MLAPIVRSKLQERFSGMAISFDAEDASVIATIAPVHSSWEPIVVVDDGDEVTVFFGKFTHVHYGNHESVELTKSVAESIADDVANELSLVFADQVEAFNCWGYFGVGGLRAYGSQGFLSKLVFGENGRLWSGNPSH
ncbi:hypothetical protein Q5Y75_27495 [Ruegeria sp. 2205SS24-7]|uniref:hypothetical protein n=1 Tax=Ruegeria discodermiae TaxID=3064389 RepID=UPI0027416C20|nr:hypothetical protein [Ruegeria sp. 2205SS24-7]MDP5220935.1 hypothetical protein [Ruegeria sp. 2205SS24-7]